MKENSVTGVTQQLCGSPDWVCKGKVINITAKLADQKYA